MTQKNDIRKLFFEQGMSISQIARETGNDRKTVRQYINQHNWNTPPKGKSPVGRPAKLEPFKETIDKWLLEDKKARKKQRHTGKRVFDRLKKLYGDEFDCCYKTVSNYVTARKKRQRSPASTSGSPLPVWAFVEIITLNQFLSFYKFCADRFKDNELKKNHELMQYYIRPLRNAAAHSNCIINDIRAGYDKHGIDPLISKAVGKIPGMSKTIRRSKFSNPRIRQIVTLLFVHKNIASPGVNNHISELLKKFKERMYKYYDYSTNQIISTSFKFLADIIDNWY